jgi:hypothetical protein
MSETDNQKKHKECEPPFWKDPSILFNHFSLEYKQICHHSPWNFLVRLLILSLFIGLIASVLGGLSFLFVALLFGGITAVAIIMTTPSELKPRWDTYHELPYIANVDPSGYLAPIKERFVNGGSSVGSIQPMASPSGVEEIDGFPYSGSALPDHTPPTSRNPFMNVLLDQIKYNPDRPSAASVDDPTVKQTLDDYFRIQWFSDPTDVFGKNQSQRQFVTQPSTTVPNDQGSFANWLYKIHGKTCKEGGREACLSGSDGGPIPWLNQAS